MHSKSYRSPSPFAGKNILVIGAGVSSTDICRELGGVANRIWQSSRGGEYDLLASMLTDNCTRVGSVAGFSPLGSTADLGDEDTLPGNVVLSSGDTINEIHHVILATGYHMSYPFLGHLHADTLSPENATETTLVTTGQVTHNLHKDIFYIPDPTLAFVGIPYHVATFSLFEFQAMAVAAIFSGTVTLPVEKEMRKEYKERVKRKGVGRKLHSLRDDEGEIVYAREMMEIVNQGRRDEDKVEGHTKEWFEAYGRRLVRMKERRGWTGKMPDTVGSVEVEEDGI
jgi:hypothetical protein